MKYHEKIREIRKEMGLSLLEFEGKLKSIFGEKALKYNTLARIERGETKPRMSSLTQICVGFQKTLKELKENVEEESTLVDLIKRNKRIDRFTYNQKAHSDILTPSKRNFVCAELTILPYGKTVKEQDPIEEKKFAKWVYCLKGKIICHIGKEAHTLKKGDCLSFESTLPHYFENKTDAKSVCIVVQNPRHI
ncbi:cupin domain-containing protein [Candidatus Omnitrophota bacterium]